MSGIDIGARANPWWAFWRREPTPGFDAAQIARTDHDPYRQDASPTLTVDEKIRAMKAHVYTYDGRSWSCSVELSRHDVRIVIKCEKRCLSEAVERCFGVFRSIQAEGWSAK